MANWSRDGRSGIKTYFPEHNRYLHNRNCTLSYVFIVFTASLLILGMIDTTDILIKQPLRHLAAYTNQKSTTSVKIQGVCDSRKFVLDISAGWLGSMHDARIYGMSSLSGAIDKKLAGTNFYILGDSAYPLSARLMKPYRNDGFLNQV